MAVSGRTDEEDESETINDLALAGIKNVTRNAEVAVDLHSAVYMFHLAQALIKHISAKDAYAAHVGKKSIHCKFQLGRCSKQVQKLNSEIFDLIFSSTVQGILITKMVWLRRSRNDWW